MIAGKGFTLFTLNEDMNDITKIMKSLEHSGVLIDGIMETVKHQTWFFGALLVSLATSIVQPVTSSVVKGINGRGVIRAGRIYVNKNFSFLSVQIILSY